MVAQIIPQASECMSLEDYFSYDNGTDTRYELVDGVLVEMPTESPENCQIAKLLMFELAKYVSLTLIHLKDLEIEVSGKRAKVRLPDLTVLSEDGQASLSGQQRNTITHRLPPPLLVIEVVSPGPDNRDRDYRYKHTEYAARGIDEYWIIDPEEQKITVCLWVNGRYDDTVYWGDRILKSTIIPNWPLTAAQILAFGQMK